MSLFEISAEVRIIIKGILIGIAVVTLLWLTFLGGRALYRALQPPKPLLPGVGFGKLPTPVVSNANLSAVAVELDNPGGTLPSFPAQLEVYPIPEPVGKVNSLDLAAQKASQLGVAGGSKQLSPTSYRWQDPKLPAESVTIDIITGNYVYKYDWLIDPSAIAKTFSRPVEEAAKTQARGFFNQGFESGNDIKKGEATATYIKLSGKNATKVSSPSEANALEVNVFREKVKGTYDITSFNPSKSLINAIVVAEGNKKVLLGNFTHWLVDFNAGSTYPLRSASEAFADLKASKAYIVSGKIDNLDTIKVIDIRLAYLETETYSAYLQPIYIISADAFAGRQKASFVAYLPAVSETYLTSQP